MQMLSVALLGVFGFLLILGGLFWPIYYARRKKQKLTPEEYKEWETAELLGEHRT